MRRLVLVTALAVLLSASVGNAHTGTGRSRPAPVRGDATVTRPPAQSRARAHAYLLGLLRNNRGLRCITGRVIPAGRTGGCRTRSIPRGEELAGIKDGGPIVGGRTGRRPSNWGLIARPRAVRTRAR